MGNKFDANDIAAVGLSVMGIIAVIGWAACSFRYGQFGGTEIALAIGSGLGGVITGKALAKNEAKKGDKNNADE